MESVAITYASHYTSADRPSGAYEYIDGIENATSSVNVARDSLGAVVSGVLEFGRRDLIGFWDVEDVVQLFAHIYVRLHVGRSGTAGYDELYAAIRLLEFAEVDAFTVALHRNYAARKTDEA